MTSRPHKLVSDPHAALADVASRMTVLVGGFGLCGIPAGLISALAARGVDDLTIVSNNAGTTDHGLVELLRTRQVRRVLASYVGENDVFEQQMLAGEIEVELVPQGTLAERLRAGGAGIAAFYTPTGAGTSVAEGKEQRDFGGHPHVLERAIRGDVGLVRAFRADTEGNLVFRKTARNFNPLVAMAARVTIVEAEEIVPAGRIDPDHVHLPGIFVQRIVPADAADRRIERLVVRDGPT